MLLFILFLGVKAYAPDTTKIEWAFKTQIYPTIRRNECGSCKVACHSSKHDTGGLTCFGVSIKHNPNFFKNTMNAFIKSCKPHPSGKLLLCKHKQIESEVKDLYFHKYAFPFWNCSLKAFKMIVDTSVLSGQGTAKRFLKDQIDCNKKFDALKWTNDRIKRYQKIVKRNQTQAVHLKGWTLRAKKMLRIYNQ